MAVILATVVCLTGISTEWTAKAANYTILLDEKKSLAANVSNTHTFYVSTNSMVGIEFDVDSQVNMSYTVKDMTSGEQASYKCNSNEWSVSNTGSGYYCSRMFSMAYGYYEVAVKFDQATNYELVVYTEQNGTTTTTPSTVPAPTSKPEPSTPTTTKPPLKMSRSKLTITAGSSKKLSVKNASGKVKWKSSKPAIATVNGSGKVTAKKAGKTTISATSGGKTVRCSVVVKRNVYTYTVPTTSNTTYGTTTFGVYNASYKNGNLVCKMKIVNRTPYKVTKVKYTVKAYTGNGKLIGQKAEKRNVTIPSGSSHTVTVTIPKSKLKKKSANLREAAINVSNPVYYYMY